ncbi:anthranilate synthase component I [Thiothrix nivea]|uniref:Anthranilate synthase component 1 n=1 Tax=Thiothrix nivea (strain ATCC 35100 / DSM 5205 / JP2) TaxID=870187 RepID=A0A656HJZ8_THINJ|nr:anthranilate synthase component I [Thiothrix nivea]EIJ36414.1 anthranilate synthase component I [Thiothrix nivea DSM 5205]
MNQDTFDTLITQGYNRVPVRRTILADLDTPLSAYLKLADAPYSYLFESVQGGEKWGRYSILGLPAKTIIKVFGHTVELHRAHQPLETFAVADPLAWITGFQQQYQVPDIEGFPRFNGGLVGYFGYETIRYIEKKLSRGRDKPDPIGTPDILLMVSDEVVVFDNLRGELHLIVLAETGGFQQAQQRLDTLERQLQEARRLYRPAPKTRQIDESDFVSGFTEQGFKDAVIAAKEYIKAGDIMQVVLSQRMSIPFEAPPLDLYRALRRLNPSPYMYFLNLGDFHIVGSSPEILVRLEDNEITVRPIAGTRKRGETEQRDQELEAELLNDPKEIAEHLMLIDLGRNDTGRVSEIGSVKLTDKMIVERYSHVMHIVSNVTGKLLPGLDAMDVLRATFPAGTVSGAPKIRAMEIIDEFEPVKRGVYSGAVGYLAWNGNMDTAIAIRTAVIKDDILHIQAGAGVVYDSVPDLEWKETMNKGRAVFRAASAALSGLNGKHK